MRRAVLLSFLVLGACASLDKENETFLEGDRAHSAAAKHDTGGCKPWFVSPSRDWGEGAPRHSCWNRLWEVPTAVVVAPIAIAIVTAPIWVPIVVLK
ncbi:MAG: hypothetical protein HYV14_04135 [Elusimicrobia bacterium]|nr:hypothetical protein [Elusimicrobiota bacterium]